MVKGTNPWKKVARLYVEFEEGDKSPLIKKGIREVTKLLYFLPIAGPVFCVISIVIYLFKGKFLHDIAGKSDVILEKDLIEEGH